MPLLFLDELPALAGIHLLADLAGRGRRVPLRFDRRDYLAPADGLDDADGPLDEKVRRVVERAGHHAPGPVAVLGNARTWGWLFNPITLYFCFDQAGVEVASMAFEVTNTPWHERHTYAVGEPGEHRVDKQLHVSPFLGMDARYRVRYTRPQARFELHIDVEGEEGVRLRTSMTLDRRPLDRVAVSTLLWHYPAMPMQVSAGIYAQAARLWRKGARFHPHPRTRG